jgi:uncharacterized DUF497 family protein
MSIQSVLTYFVRSVIMDLQFEWDEAKNNINQMKHKVSFEYAINVFDDPVRRVSYDWKHNSVEERWKAIGMAGWDMLTVIFTERDGVIRIISARKAIKNEKEEYLAWL